MIGAKLYDKMNVLCVEVYTL